MPLGGVNFCRFLAVELIFDWIKFSGRNYFTSKSWSEGGSAQIEDNDQVRMN
jgi:hypothetical protein